MNGVLESSDNHDMKEDKNESRLIFNEYALFNGKFGARKDHYSDVLLAKRLWISLLLSGSLSLTKNKLMEAEKNDEQCSALC